MLGNMSKFLIFDFPLAGVAKWQTRWTQNPVDYKSVWVRVPPPARIIKPKRYLILLGFFCCLLFISMLCTTFPF